MPFLTVEKSSEFQLVGMMFTAISGYSATEEKVCLKGRGFWMWKDGVLLIKNKFMLKPLQVSYGISGDQLEAK
jgi:hypothetical protein